MVILSLAGACAAAILLLPVLSDLVSLMRLPWRRGIPGVPRTPPATSRFLFLIPAHNEETLIEECVRSVLAMDYPRDRVTVVVLADNCSDRTAIRARACGVECWERVDPVLRGKPRA